MPSPVVSLAKVADEAGWWTVATYGEGVFDDRFTKTWVVRGWRRAGEDVQRFVMIYLFDPELGGKAGPSWKPDAAYWWTRHHTAQVHGYRLEEGWTKVNAWSMQQTKRYVLDVERDEKGKIVRYLNDETISFQSEKPEPVRVSGVNELKTLIRS
jgi:hypothetical protein